MEIMDIDCSEYLEYLHCCWNTMEIKGIFCGNVVGMGGLLRQYPAKNYANWCVSR